jgi:hypothetical protein
MVRLYAMTEGVDAPDPVPITLAEAAKDAGFVLVPIDRLLIATGARYFATDAAGMVHLPMDHIRRSVANEIAQQIAAHLQIEAKWDGYRLRTFMASIQVILPPQPTIAPSDDRKGDQQPDHDEAAAT